MGITAGAAAKNDDVDERRGGLVVGSLDRLVEIIVIRGGSAATETLPQLGYLLWQLFSFFAGCRVGPKTGAAKSLLLPKGARGNDVASLGISPLLCRDLVDGTLIGRKPFPPKPRGASLDNATIRTDALSERWMAGEMIIFGVEVWTNSNRHFQTGTCFALRRNSH
jgi:hypothetical protein